eukprot:3702576-Alexandrium_andersonii.AAC.1
MGPPSPSVPVRDFGREGFPRRALRLREARPRQGGAVCPRRARLCVPPLLRLRRSLRALRWPRRFPGFPQRSPSPSISLSCPMASGRPGLPLSEPRRRSLQPPGHSQDNRTR